MDAFSAMERSFVKIPTERFRRVFSQGQVTNQGEPMDCFPQDRPARPWTLGSEIKHQIKNVRNFVFLRHPRSCSCSCFASLSNQFPFPVLHGFRKVFLVSLVRCNSTQPEDDTTTLLTSWNYRSIKHLNLYVLRDFKLFSDVLALLSLLCC